MTAEERMRLKLLIDSRKRQRIARIVLSGIEHRERIGEVTQERAAQVRAKMEAFAPSLRVVPDPASDERRTAVDTILRHQYRQPVPGFCMGYINLGPKWSSTVRCSRRARFDGLCGTHKKKQDQRLAQAA